jgi:hypothetical protein
MRNLLAPLGLLPAECVFSMAGPQPFQIGCAKGSGNGLDCAQRPAAGPAASLRILRPVMYSAISRRSAPVNGSP